VLHDDIVYIPKTPGPLKWRCRVCLRRSYAKYYQKKCQERAALGLTDLHRARRPLAKICGNGHVWNEETTYIAPKTGQRQCRPCRTARLARFKARRAAAQAN
jgi:hypothetical protein